MFSTMPRIGTSTWWNIEMALVTSNAETAWGVVTRTAPERGTS